MANKEANALHNACVSNFGGSTWGSGPLKSDVFFVNIWVTISEAHLAGHTKLKRFHTHSPKTRAR